MNRESIASIASGQYFQKLVWGFVVGGEIVIQVVSVNKNPFHISHMFITLGGNSGKSLLV